MGDENVQVDQRCDTIPATKRHIISSLHKIFNQHNASVKLFKTSINNLPTDNYGVQIRANKTPVGHHAGCYNAPPINEVAVIIVGEESDTRDLVLQRRNNTIERVVETH